MVGARPNFMKASPLARELSRRSVPYHIIHTGQHYDKNMAAQFFSDFGLVPDTVFSLSATTATTQLAEIMTKLEEVYLALHPKLVVVFGDVTSTLAGALVANKMHIPLAHVEAGLRSYNKLMPEEMHRKVTDHIADILFAPTPEDSRRLRSEGVTENVHVVGNIMLDLLKTTADTTGHTNEGYYFATLHRGENVDRKNVFEGILTALEYIAHDAEIILPLHPRTEKMARKHGLFGRLKKAVTLRSPVSYAESVALQKHALLVLTDSGGIQEETTFLGVPCLTLRTETERPITVTKGTNTIAGVDAKRIIRAYESAKPFRTKRARIPLWDGNTAARIVDILEQYV